jgi:hypothetical protein
MLADCDRRAPLLLAASKNQANKSADIRKRLLTSCYSVKMDQFLRSSAYGRQWRAKAKAGRFCGVQNPKSSLILLTFTRYRHAVTRARNRVLAPETGGGILADEMGMGKSLSALALLTNTLDKAHEWVRERKANPDPHNRQKPCRATLVVVPSASKSPSGFEICSGSV